MLQWPIFLNCTVVSFCISSLVQNSKVLILILDAMAVEQEDISDKVLFALIA